MSAIPINWIDLEAAFQAGSDDPSSIDSISNYFDKTTGQVVVLDETVNSAVESVMDELTESDFEDAAWTEDDLRQTQSYQDQPDWVKPLVLIAIEMEQGSIPDRLESIPHFNSRESYEWMEAFIETIEDESVRERLSAAIHQRRPFRQFREAFGTDRRLQQQWRSFETARQRETIIDWLRGIDVQPLNPDESTYDPPPLPDLRNIMFAEVRRFVRFVRDLPGVHRIALIGSLTTDKEFPKDIDMLVTISENCDLFQLALFGRQLSGHMMAHGAGADVFLAGANGKYLGRTCPWKDCGPGIRRSCDAQSCGLRPYLHNDFSSIRLSQELIQSPPVLLWPDLTNNATTPTDVVEQLIVPLSQDPHR